MTTEILDEPANVLALKYNTALELFNKETADLKLTRERLVNEEKELSRLQDVIHPPALCRGDFQSYVEFDKAVRQRKASAKERAGLQEQTYLNLDVIWRKIEKTRVEIGKMVRNLRESRMKFDLLNGRMSAHNNRKAQ
jgi:hypothetical protein